MDLLITTNGKVAHRVLWEGEEARKELERFRQKLIPNKIHLLLMQRDSEGSFASAFFFGDHRYPENDILVEYLFESPAERRRYHPYVRDIAQQIAKGYRKLKSSTSTDK